MTVDPARLPTFLVIGAMKAGTSALHDWLGEHPDCFTTTRKELDYFAVPQYAPGGLEWYAQQFDAARPDQARGESSPSYAMRPMYAGVPELIAETLPDVRLVYCVRHPVDRVVSNYLHALAGGFETRPLEQVLSDDDRYVRVSSYATQLAPYLDLFPAGAVLVEDLTRPDPSALDRICHHLGLDPARMPHKEPQRSHVTADKLQVRPWARRQERRTPRLASSTGWQRLARRPLQVQKASLSPDARARLEDTFRPEVERLLPWLAPGHDGWGLADRPVLRP